MMMKLNTEDLKVISKKIKKLAPLLLISLAIHLFLLLILALIRSEKEEETKTIVIVTDFVEEEEAIEEVEEIEEVEMVNEEVVVDTEITETETEEVVEIEEVVEETEEVEELVELEMITTPTQTSLDFAVLGFAGNPTGGAAKASGLLAGRFSSAAKRKAAGAKNLNLVNQALSWLAKQQKGGGSWPSEAHPNAINGACALAFLGNGNSTQSGRYKDVVSKFVDYYLKNEPEDGGHGNHGHATPFVVMAMCDAYAMDNEHSELRGYCERAIQYVCNTQLNNGGWSGGGRTAEKSKTEVDVAQSAWYTMALVSARLAKIPYPEEVLVKARSLFTRLASNNFSETIKVTSHGGQDNFFDRKHCTASYSATNLIFTGVPSSNKTVDALGKYIIHNMPAKGERNYWLLYNQGLGLFQMGDRSNHWSTFKNRVLKDLGDESIKSSDGVYWSNRKIYTNQNQKSDTGARVHYWGDCGATAMAVLNLQVFYRYGDIQQAYQNL